MPLSSEIRQEVLEYCDRHVESRSRIPSYFDFIDDVALRNQIVSEYVAARYIYKLGEALLVDEERLHAHVKFQIVQFASIYEVMIVYMLWEKFREHEAVRKIEYHDTYKRIAKLPNNVRLVGKPDIGLSICERSAEKTAVQSIKFDDKVNASVEIGFIDAEIADEIKLFYKMRNGIHIESTVKNQIKFELESSLLAYRRIKPVTTGMKAFLKTGALPKAARPKQSTDPVTAGVHHSKPNRG